MKKRMIYTPRLAIATVVSLLAAVIGTGPSRAQDQTREQDRLRAPIYGSQLMTQQERARYQEKIRTLNSEQEREAFRLEHHTQMQERAKTQGLTLPESPPNPRPALGSGPHYGGGKGPGPEAGNKK